ncbi:PaaX family transcriptional regulator C-terminal domain-containing protein [Streptomyces silaceus]|uniref:PaaX family transcriptional regulator C-terminal domain-containing protein n=1 Tax=Streptomyces silaceus TaxID=545123 RepID=UPI0006EB9D30|nr:PaaX family transcriptional regulator C-terminal domain-containing protein [Streptomyces silaceus]
MWIAADAGGVAALKDLLREQGLAPHATWLVARGEDDGEIVARAWDLTAVRAAHEEFVGRFGAVRADSDEAAFVLRTRLVHAWRGTFERDPRLPRQLLPPDWPGFASTKLFIDTWRGLRVPADRHWRRLARDPRA